MHKFNKVTYPDGQLSIAEFRPAVETHGPGVRIGVWPQGCPLRCEGCINPHMQEFKPLGLQSPEEFLHWVRQSVNCVLKPEGISFMGGEMLSQSQNLAPILENIETEFPDLNMLLFTGFKYEILRKLNDSDVNRVLDIVDTVIDGPYIEKYQNPASVAGSTNQNIIHLNKKRLANRDFSRATQAAYFINQSGQTTVSQSGFEQTDFIKK